MPRYSHTYALSLLSILSIICSPCIIAEGGGDTPLVEPIVIMSTPAVGDKNSADSPESIINSLNTPMSPTISEDTPAGTGDELVGDVSDNTTPDIEEIAPPVDEDAISTPHDPDPSMTSVEILTPAPEESTSDNVANEATVDTPVIEPSNPIGIGEKEKEDEDRAIAVQASATYTPRVIQLTVTLPSGER